MRSSEASTFIGLTGVSPTSATWQSSNGATLVAGWTLRKSRDISRIWAGPERAPGRKKVPMS